MVPVISDTCRRGTRRQNEQEGRLPQDAPDSSMWGGIVRKVVDEVRENHTKDFTNRASSIRRPMTKVNSLPNNVEFPWILGDPGELFAISWQCVWHAATRENEAECRLSVPEPGITTIQTGVQQLFFQLP